MVIVVGAGPAGATAARTLARAGVTVRLLDRSKFPRNKPCGGGISLRVLKRFPYLAAELSRIATHTVGRLYLEGPGGESTVIEADGPAALMIRRVEFDALLVDLACEAGAELIGGVDIVRASTTSSGVVLESRDGRTFEAPIVIAADGVHSVIARRLGLNPGLAGVESCARHDGGNTARKAARRRSLDTVGFVRASAVDSQGRRGRARKGGTAEDQRSGASAAEGYAYIFPKRDHVNVGIGYVLDHYRNAIDVPPYDLAARIRGRFTASGRDGGRIRAQQLHAVHHSGRRAAREARSRPRAARRRCRRLRERVHRGGDLLRDGVRRPCGAHGHFDTGTCDQDTSAPIPACRSTRSRRRASRLRADSTVPVCGSSENCRRHSTVRPKSGN